MGDRISRDLHFFFYTRAPHAGETNTVYSTVSVTTRFYGRTIDVADV